MQFEPYPFEKLNKLLEGITPAKPAKKLTIGEPQFPTPKSIQKALIDSADELRYYPASKGEDYLKKSILDFIRRRFGAKLDFSQMLPTFGTREVLFNFPQWLFANIKAPVLAHPNPFYQIYEGAAKASGAKSIYMNLTPENGFKPTLSKEQMQLANLVILNSPNNPTGVALSLEELKIWAQNALEYDFVLLNDECYSEIYQHTPPASILQASLEIGNSDFKNILAINSISKRCSAPGLRSGFIAGDKAILEPYALYRTYAGLAIPLPLQRAAAIAWSDAKEAESIRQTYAQNLSLAQSLFPSANVASFSFYMWLFVGDDLAFAKQLYAQSGLVVLPGSFLGREGAGRGFVRVALVYEPSIMREMLESLLAFYETYTNSRAHNLKSAISANLASLPPLSTAKVHFIGIGGIGISGLAKYLKAQGATISGSDIAHSPTTHYLRSLGANITIPHDKKAIKDQHIIIHSAIIKQDNPEILLAQRKHIPVLSRKQALSLILDSKRVYSVCGAHGKSTTSAMLSAIFNEYGAIIGAESKEFHSNVREVSSQSIVFEADESDKSFLNSNPYFAIVPNAEPEHLETYNHNVDELHSAYREFLCKAKVRVINKEDEFLARFSNEAKSNQKSSQDFSQNSSKDSSHKSNKNPRDTAHEKRQHKDYLPHIALYPSKDISDISYTLKNEEPYTRFCLKDLGVFEVWGFGEHIALNASLAILAALESKARDLLESSPKSSADFAPKDSSYKDFVEYAKKLDKASKEKILQEIRTNLANFCGIKKRFDILTKENLTIIDDYAHHPTEILATLNSLEIYAKLRNIKEICIIWQPHKYSRLFDNLVAFQQCFSTKYRLVILPVWAAGEEVREVDFASLFAHAKPTLATRIARTNDAITIFEGTNPIDSIKKGIVIGFGAGDITYQLRGMK